MKISEVMTRKPEVVRPDATIQDAARKMDEFNIGSLPVCDGERLVGMITDRDIVIRTVAENRNPLELQAGDVMTGDIVTVSPEASVEECANLMESKQIRRVAVVDESGALCGMIAQADIAINAPG